MVFTEDGPDTRGRNEPRKPHTRSQSRQGSSWQLYNLKLRCTWCFCAGTDIKLTKRTELQRRVKPRTRDSDNIKPHGDIIPKSQASVIHRLKDDILSCEVKPGTPVNVKACFKESAKRGRDRQQEQQEELEGSVKAKSSRWDHEYAAAAAVNTGAQLTTRSSTTGLSSKVHLSA